MSYNKRKDSVLDMNIAPFFCQKGQLAKDQIFVVEYLMHSNEVDFDLRIVSYAKLESLPIDLRNMVRAHLAGISVEELLLRDESFSLGHLL